MKPKLRFLCSAAALAAGLSITHWIAYSASPATSADAERAETAPAAPAAAKTKPTQKSRRQKAQERRESQEESPSAPDRPRNSLSFRVAPRVERLPRVTTVQVTVNQAPQTRDSGFGVRDSGKNARRFRLLDNWRPGQVVFRLLRPRQEQPNHDE